MTVLSIKTADLPEKNINRIKEVVVEDCSEVQLNALRRSAHIAICLLTTEAGLDNLLASLDTDTVSREELLKHFDSFEVYVIDWNGSDDAFHTPTKQCAPEVKVGNVFVKLEDVRMLPTTELNVWTAEERAYVLLVAWFIMHEMCHAIGSLLCAEGLLPTDATPTKATGFLKNGHSMTQFVSSRDGILCGERGWYMEDKLGGQLRFQMSTGRLFLRRPELMKYWEVQPEIIKRIVEAEEPTHLNDIIPLSRNGDGFEMEAKEEILLKGRDAGDTATRAVIRERPLKYRGF